jgi:hypothetical protein
MRWNAKNKTGTITSHGYRLITIDGKRVYEHRCVAEKSMGRKLKPKEQVHHINGLKLDNRPENLEVLDISKHLGIEHTNGKYKKHLEKLNGVIIKTTLICEWCKTPYFKIKRRHTRRFCSAACRNKWLATI